MYAYLFTHNTFRSRDLASFFDETESIEHWVKFLPMAFILVSEESASEISVRVREAFNGEINFIIVDTSAGRAGWIPRNVWDILKNPNNYSKEKRWETLAKRLAAARDRKKKS